MYLVGNRGKDFKPLSLETEITTKSLNILVHIKSKLSLVGVLNLCCSRILPSLCQSQGWLCSGKSCDSRQNGSGTGAALRLCSTS